MCNWSLSKEWMISYPIWDNTQNSRHGPPRIRITNALYAWRVSIQCRFNFRVANVKHGDWTDSNDWLKARREKTELYRTKYRVVKTYRKKWLERRFTFCSLLQQALPVMWVRFIFRRFRGRQRLCCRQATLKTTTNLDGACFSTPPWPPWRV